MEIRFTSIGTIHSPFQNVADMPIQPASETSASGIVELLPEFTQGLIGLEGFSHIILIYYLHASISYSLIVTPFLDENAHGVFATRAPRRPNPIGLSVVELRKVVENLLYVDHLDILDGTPLLDIKPYVPEFDAPTVFRLGWLESKNRKVKSTHSDDRFLPGEDQNS